MVLAVLVRKPDTAAGGNDGRVRGKSEDCTIGGLARPMIFPAEPVRRPGRLRYRAWRRCIEATDAQIDDLERVDTEVREVIMNGLAKLSGSERSGPISLRVPQCADLGDDP